MKSDPHNESIATPETRSTRWLSVAGVSALILATVCFDAAVISMFGAFQLLAEPTATVQPSELASGIGGALAFSIATLPLRYLGVVLLILGFFRRQPATTV